MSAPAVHNVRFYKPKPYAAYSMVLKKSENLLAIARSDNSIEIWNLNNAPFIERRIPPIVDNNYTQQLCWCNDRLFSVNLNGFLVEYDLYNLTVKHKSAVTGEAAYCLDANNDNSQIAIGTEQGFLNIFSVNEDVLFEKFLDKQEGSILCLKYFPNGQYIASGSTDTVRIWNVKSGQAIHKITTGRTEANKETIVWDLQVTSEGIVISGDSRGKITFWDGKVGSQIESFQSHRADILSVCLSDDEKSLYCAGADPLIISYEKVNVKSTSQKWVKSIQRRIHDHDVRCLVLLKDKLYSCGIDGYLACSYHPPKTVHKFPPLLPSSCINVSSERKILLLQYSLQIEIWELAKVANGKEQEGLFKLDSLPKKLVQLFRTVKNLNNEEENEGIICSALSNDGRWITFSTNTAVRIFNFKYDENRPSLTPLEDISKELPICLKATFTKDSRYLILGCRGGILKVVDLLSNFSTQTVELTDVLDDTISFMEVSLCGNYFVIGDCRSNIVIFSKNSSSKWKQYCKLPKYQKTLTAITISPHKPSLLAVYADQKIIEYNIQSRKISAFSQILDNTVANKWFNKWNAIKNVVFDPEEPQVILFYDDSSVIVVKKNKHSSEPDNKILKLENNRSQAKSSKQQITVKLIKKYKHLMYLNWLSQNEMIAVEVKPLSLTEQLPPCLKQNLFGTK